MERLSTQTQESGFVSMHSQRSSSQSYTASNMTSKRSSQQSSISYNSQSFAQQQSFSQTKSLSSDSNGSIFTQKTMTSSKSTISTSNVSGNGDPTLVEKLVNINITMFYVSILFLSLLILLHSNFFYNLIIQCIYDVCRKRNR